MLDSIMGMDDWHHHIQGQCLRAFHANCLPSDTTGLLHCRHDTRNMGHSIQTAPGGSMYYPHFAHVHQLKYSLRRCTGWQVSHTMDGRRSAQTALGGSMWLGQDEAQAALATLQGKGHKGRANLQRLLSEIIVVEVRAHPCGAEGCAGAVWAQGQQRAWHEEKALAALGSLQGQVEKGSVSSLKLCVCFGGTHTYAAAKRQASEISATEQDIGG